MQKKENQPEELDKTLAAVCGLYCEGCTLYIATMEDPARLKELAARFQLTEEAISCYGCRSHKRGPYCQECKMVSCAAERGIDFCIECEEYPCKELKEFQAEKLHRIELFDDLERIKSVGYKKWLQERRENYSCPQCTIINSAYDMKCRKCGEEPANNYVAKNKQAIEEFLKNR
ncbi:MAG: DUF3795 domain-containing protein [bacterium]|nr:DUF3795 domain-containing protein [bacterium]